MELFDLSVRWIVENWLLVLFVVIQIGLLVFAWRKLSSEENAWHTRTNAWASFLTVFGIFGTFLGIFLGLMGFNVEDIEGSIGPLLEGLKLAFVTSLVGIASALGLRGVALHKTRSQDNLAIKAFTDALTETLKTVETSGEINLFSQLKALTKTVGTEGQKTRDSLGGIKTDLVGIQTAFTKNHTELTTMQSEEGSQTRRTLKEMEASLADGQNANLTQLRGLTTTFAEKHDLLVGEFRTFSQNLADSIAKLATDELIGALKKVIEEFNTKITEQFGDNFKELNDAVRQTVTWQGQYREQMSGLISQMSKLISELGDAAETFEKARDSLEDIAKNSRLISERSESIVACAEKLDPILHTLNGQLEAFSELRERAQEAIPLIQNGLDKLTKDFSASVDAAIKASNKSVAIQRVALKKQTDELDKALRQSTQHMIEQVEHLDKNLKEQLKKALGSLADQLASLSEKFAEDYLPLTDALRQVLTIAKRILPVDDNPS